MRATMLHGLAKSTEALACLCFAGFMLAILAQISYRYLGITLVFSEEAARMLNIYVIFIGVVYVTATDGHIKIDIIDRLLSNNPLAIRLLRYIGLLSALVFFIFLAIGSYQLTQSGWHHRLATIPWLTHGHIYLAPLVGSVLSSIILVIRLTDWSGNLDKTRFLITREE